MSVSCWDPLCLLDIKPRPQLPCSAIDNPIIERIDYEFLKLKKYIWKTGSSLNAPIDPLINAINLLYDEKNDIFAGIELSKCWQLFVHKITRLLLEKLAFEELRASRAYQLSTADQVLRADSLERNGYFTTILPQEAIAKIKLMLRPQLHEIKTNLASGRSSREELSTNEIPAPIVEYLNALFAELDLLYPLQAYTGGITNVSGFALEISAPQAEWWSARLPKGQRPEASTAYFHRDETCFVPKALVYLSDVDDDCGPFSVCPSSYGQEKSEVCAAASRVNNYPYQVGSAILAKSDIQLFRDNLPKCLNIDSHYGFDIPNSSVVADTILQDEIRFCGKSGTCVVFDGYNVLHRGGLATRRPRLALQVMLPIHIPNLHSLLQHTTKLAFIG